MSLPKILFFARGYQADYFPTIQSDRYEPVFVTLTRAERLQVEARGARVAACFEEDFDGIVPAEIPHGYLLSAFPADRFLGRFGLSERRDILGRMISFWRRLLDEHQPRAVVNELVAIEISEVLLIEARARGIRYLAGMNCVVDDYFYWLPDPISLSGRHLSLPEPDDRAIALAEAYVEELQAADYRPFYVKNLSGRWALKPLLAAIARYLEWQWRIRLAPGFRYEDYREEYGKRLAIAMRAPFHRYDRLEDIRQSAEIIFYPLHQEPEATLNYMSEFYADQVATIENILRCLQPHQVLVVKEHPVDKGSLIRSKFMNLRRRSSALYFLPAEVHGRQVLARTSRVVTLTSTVGWEAVATGRIVYVLGQIFYDHFPGVRRIADFNELKAALRQPEPERQTEGPAALADFVARMVMMSYPGNPFPHEGLYTEESRRKVAHAIADAALA